MFLVHEYSNMLPPRFFHVLIRYYCGRGCASTYCIYLSFRDKDIGLFVLALGMAYIMIDTPEDHMVHQIQMATTSQVSVAIGLSHGF